MSLEKWLVAGVGQGKHKMSPRHLVPGSKGMLKEWNESKGNRGQSEEVFSGQIWDNLSIK